VKADALHRALIEHAPSLFALLDTELVVRYVNPALSRLLGYEPSHVAGKSIERLLHPDDKTPFRGRVALALADSKPAGICRLRVKDSQGAWLEMEGAVVTLKGGPAVGSLLLELHDASERRRIQRELQESEARFRLMADHAPVMIWLDGPDMNLIFENRTALDFMGRTLEEEKGLGWTDNLHPDDREMALAAYRTAAQVRQPYSTEYRVRRHDGVWRRVLDKGVPRWLEDGSFAGYVGCHIDVTDIRDTTEQLRASEELHRALVAALQEGIVMHQADGTIVACNASAERILGVAPGQLTGQRSLSLKGPALDQEGNPIPEEDQPAMVTLRTGQMLTDVVMAVHKSEHELCWLSIGSRPLINAGEDRPYAAVTSFTDITDRLAAECELRQSEERYRAFVEHASEGVWRAEFTEPIPVGLPVETIVPLLLERAYVAECNSAFARMYGYEQPGEMIGIRVTEVHSADDPRTVEYLTTCVQNGFRAMETESVERDREGRTKYFMNNWVGIIEDGKLVRIWGTQRDITDRKVLEEQFRQARKMETAGRLAGGIAHDFNNLLTAILGMSDLLLGDLAPGDPHRSDVEEIKRAASRAASLTRQLLAFSRRQVLQPKILDVNAVVRATETMLRRVIGEDINLVTDLATDLGLIKADPGQLDQVILNLAVNSRDAMPRGGNLAITTRNARIEPSTGGMESIMPPGRYIALSVSDTGTGMSPEIQRHLFEPFYTTKEPGKGTGLGLATVYGIVKQSGGYIFADTEPGRGTTFRIYLPRAQGKAEEPDTLQTHVPETVAAGTILLVEDEEAVRKLARRVLEGSGYKVLEARDGKAALNAVAAHPGPLDLVLTDVVMPGMSGQELSARLVAQRPGLNVLYVSGYTDDAILQHGRLLPNTAFLQKPFSPATLVSKVQEVLGR
jgi:PAS domain S-box-containing protein